ncbi:lipoyl(octanoyl) transferase LipB [Naasia lichenicola]|uniref:Octanoyltransferase n=1 Tax=Naasia lichenicola TaxID=2565933 RepID=A0A4S4FMK8_9MICO|nr:lipoyl(octanoyl) transferase LipB [Naasia lichenicola]THG31750.1 lipoyl(octanoyl) transferase LipB [Naasia lichenicola]
MADIVHAGLAPEYLDYRAGWDLQRRIHREVVTGERPDTVIFCEHQSVYTAGKRTLPVERPVDSSIPVIDVDRGGKITWHGPGQLVGYPIVRLREPIDVVAFVRRLEAVMLDVLAELGVEAQRVQGRSGVWVRRDSPFGGEVFDKVGAIGLRVQEGVTMHGFALNCSNELTPYAAIIPCGISDAGVTTISAILGRSVTPTDIVGIVTRHLEAAVLHSDAGTSAIVREVAA